MSATVNANNEPRVNASDRVNILMVDDQPSKLLSYEVILSELGHNLIKATSGREALDHLLRKEVAVVLMDVSMPELDGFEVADTIRQHPRFQNTAIIFISAVHLTDLDQVRGYERGAVDYISVPIVPKLLRAKVSVFADLYRKTRQLEVLNRELESRAAELKTAEDKLRSLSSQLMRSQDDERRRIARELHDGLGQHLVAVKMRADSLRLSSRENEKVRDSLTDMARQIDEAIAETRTMSYLLHPPLLDELGLKSALLWYAEGYSARSGIAVDVTISPAIGRLEPEAETALFRVVQECLTNIHRHSGSPTATIELSCRTGEIKLEVRDEGRGISNAAPSPSGRGAATFGIGIEGMKERVRQLGGQIGVLSRDDAKGTTVVVTVPDSLRIEAFSKE
jgi:signal transduction histidine kinase